MVIQNYTLPSSDIVVEKISLWKLGGYFAAYLLIHSSLGIFYNIKIKELEKDKENKDLIEQVKWLRIAFKWFPAVYVVLVILALAF